MPRTFGYCRVSSDEQVTHLQLDALARAGVAAEDVSSDEGISGSKPARERPGFSALLARVTEGDTIVVWKLDRLGRSVVDLLNTVDELRVRGVHFRSLPEEISTASAMGKMVFTMIAAMAKLERSQLIERTRAGMAAAKARGAKIGRPSTPAAVQERLRRLVAAGENVAEAGRIVGVSRATAFRILAAAPRASRVQDRLSSGALAYGAGFEGRGAASSGTRG